MCSISKVIWYTILCLYHICSSLDSRNVTVVQDKPSVLQNHQLGNEFISSRTIRLKRQTYRSGHYDRRRNLDREYERNRAEYERTKAEYERKKIEHERRLAEHHRRRLELEQRTRGRGRELTQSSTQQRHSERSRVNEPKNSHSENQIKDIKSENRVGSPSLSGQFDKKPDIQEEFEKFDFPLFPDFPNFANKDDDTVFATPDGFPINPEEFGLDWETILNEPSITDIHANLTNLEQTVISVQEEQYEIKRGLNLVLEEMGTLRAEMKIFQRSLNDSLTDVKKTLHKQDKSLSHERKMSEKIQHKIRLLSKMPVSQDQMLKIKNETDSVIDYTRKQIQKVRKKMSSIDNSWSKFRLAWGNRLKDIGSIARESRGAGKQHTLAISNLAANVSSLRNGVRGLQILSGKGSLSTQGFNPRGGCDSGTVSFSNYPFNSANWPQREKLRFKQDFPFIPKVGYGVTAMDTSYRYNTRIRIKVEKVTRQSFVLYCSGWHNSRLYQVEVAWMAC